MESFTTARRPVSGYAGPAPAPEVAAARAALAAAVDAAGIMAPAREPGIAAACAALAAAEGRAS